MNFGFAGAKNVNYLSLIDSGAMVPEKPETEYPGGRTWSNE